jgi:hypothetical protein
VGKKTLSSRAAKKQDKNVKRQIGSGAVILRKLIKKDS